MKKILVTGLLALLATTGIMYCGTTQQRIKGSPERVTENTTVTKSLTELDVPFIFKQNVCVCELERIAGKETVLDYLADEGCNGTLDYTEQTTSVMPYKVKRFGGPMKVWKVNPIPQWATFEGDKPLPQDKKDLFERYCL